MYCFSLWIHHLLFAASDGCSAKVSYLWNWLFLASLVWNGITEAKGSCSPSLSKCSEDSWRGGHQPANMSQCTPAPGGGQPLAAHCHPAVQHHAGKHNFVLCIIQSNLKSALQISEKTKAFISLSIPFFPMSYH